MVPNIRLGATALLTTLAMTAAVGAWKEAAGPSIDDQLKVMQAKFERLHDDNVQMKREIRELRLLTGDQWLTERRAEEIRALVLDVLEDAQGRASTLQNGLLAGWSDHFFLASPDGRFKLALEGQMQFRWVYSYRDYPDRHRHGFENTRTKLTFRGHVFKPDLTYLVRGDFNRADGPLLLEDAWMQYRINDNWLIRIGQFKVPYSREELVSSAYQLAVERSLVNESMNFDRSQGIQLTYAADTWKLMIMVHDGVGGTVGGFTGITNTVGRNFPALNQDVEWSLAARYEWLMAGQWEQFADFTSPPGEEFALLFGLGGATQQNEYGTGYGTARDEPRMLAATADLSAEWGGAHAFGSLNYIFVDHHQYGHISIWGIVIQGGVYFTPKLEVFGRWEYGWWDFDTMDYADLNALTLGVNYYLDGHDAKWTTDIGFGISRIEAPWDSDLAGYRMDADDSEPQIVFRTQFQLLF